MDKLAPQENKKAFLYRLNDSETVSVVFACDKTYLPFFGVALTSLLTHISDKRDYEIFLLGQKITQEDLYPIHSLINQYPNAHFEYIDLGEFISQDQEEHYFLVNKEEHVSQATYYRLYIPEIFQDKTKIIYLDSDLVVLSDIALLYDIPLNNNLIAATQDYGGFHWESLKIHLSQVLKLNPPESYFNAGVLVFNLTLFNEQKVQSHIFSILSENHQFLCHDQCILNIVCEKQVFFLPQSWNVKSHLFSHHENLEKCLDSKAFSDFQKGIKNPSIFHFSSEVKPWISHKIPGIDLFWKYAVMSPFFSLIILQYVNAIAENGRNENFFNSNISDILFYRRNKLNYIIAKISYIFSYGTRKKNISHTIKKLKSKIRNAKSFYKQY